MVKKSWLNTHLLHGIFTYIWVTFRANVGKTIHTWSIWDMILTYCNLIQNGDTAGDITSKHPGYQGKNCPFQMAHECGSEVQISLGGNMDILQSELFFPEILTRYDDDVNLTTQWVELLTSFRITTGLATPVKRASRRQVWQSLSIYPWLSPHKTLGQEVSAFTSACAT